MKNGRRIRMAAWLLTIVMLFEMMPLSVFASGFVVSETESTQEDLQTTELDLLEEAVIVGEDVSRRSEFEKHYILSDNTRLAITYAQPVHIMEDGVWEAVDYSLEYELADLDITNDFTGYVNRIGSTTVKFAENSSNDELFRITDGDYSISVNPISISHSSNSSNVLVSETSELSFMSTNSNVVASIQSATESVLEYNDEVETHEFNKSVIQNALAGDTVNYTNMIDGVDYEYSVSGNGIKENIIVRKRLSDYTFHFLVNLEGLTPTLQNDGSIILSSSETSEAEYIIPAPYMYDANMVYSKAVEYSIANIRGDIWILSIEADDEWANTAALPIVVDPAIIKATETGIDIINATPNGNTVNSLDLRIGYYNSNLTKSSVLATWNSIDSPRPADVMIDAGLYMYFLYTAGITFPDISVRQVSSEWTSSTISATNLPDTSSTHIDYIIPGTISEYVKIDITNVMQDYYNTGTTNGIILQSNSSVTTEYVAAMGNNSVFSPYIAVRYMNQSGLESDWTFTETDAGFAGKSYVNVFNGNLVHVKEDFTSSSPIMPLSISHIYNGNYSFLDFSADCAYLNTCCYTDMYIGSGWKLSIQESIVPASMTELSLDSQYKYIYNDADGTDHYIYLDGEQYIDDEGMGLTLTISDTEYTLSDSSGYKKVFKIISETVKNVSYLNGYLLYEEDKNGNRITYTYDTTIPTRVVSVSDPSGTTVYLNYNSDGYLTSLVAGDRTITYTYSASYISTSNAVYDLLTSVTDSYGGSAAYTYGNIMEICGKTILSASDNTGKVVEYSYDHPSELQFRISSIETKIESLHVNGIDYTYSDRKSSSLLYYGNDGVKNTDDDIYITYVFDRNGNNILVYTENKDRDVIYSAEMYGYSAETGAAIGGTDYKLLNTASSGIIGRNLLSVGNAEATACDLTANNTILSVTDTERFEGSHSYRIMTTAASNKAFTTASLTAGKEYTFSAYVKSDNIPSGKIFIQAYSPTDVLLGETTLDVTNTNANINNGWERISVNFTAESTGAHSLYIGITNGSGCVVYADALKLEETLPYSPTAYNLIQNSGFESGLNGWIVSHASKTRYASSVRSGVKAVTVTGDPREDIMVYQNINVTGNAKSSYIISGWAKANSLNTDTEDRTFGLYAKVYYNVYSGDEIVAADAPVVTVIPFTWETTEWQYVSGIIDLPYENVAAITSIDAGVQYKNNANSVIFDDIALIEGSAVEYKYDTNGNVTEIVVDGDSEYKYVYDGDGNVTSILEPDGSVYMSYTYNEDGNLTSVIDSEGTVLYEYEYDSYGNVSSSTDTKNSSTSTNTYNAFGQSTGSATSKTIDDITITISKSQTYDPVTKLLLSETDSLNNTTNYTYNSKMLLTMVEDALNIRTKYVYNSNNSLSSVYIDKDKDSVYDLSETGITYTYDSYGRITGITTKGVTYTIAYNNYDLVSSISVGNIVLCSYDYNSTYTEIVNVSYGEGQYLSYTYDILGNVSQISCGNTVIASYSYDWNGNVVYEHDSKANIITKCFYDNSGTLCGTRVHSDDYVLYTYVDDETENVSSSIYDINGTILEYQSVYDEETDTTKFVLPTGDYITSDDDAFGRIATRSLKSSADSNLVEYEYGYYTNNGNTSNLVSDLTAVVGSTVVDMDYTYDAVGNITKEYRNNVLIKEYTYDDLGQLSQEVNHSTGVTTSYFYDSHGNLSLKQINSNGSSTIETYSYSNAWKDQLTTYNGTSITYTDRGYPLNWPELGAITWDKTSLKTADGWTMNYNASGIRTSKVKETDSYIYETYYVLDGTRILSMREISYNKTIGVITADSTIYFMYDESGSPIGMRMGSRLFYYVKNLQGDIVAITDATGAIVAEYTYDAWGKILSVTGSNTSIANTNPFRYRGYFWDDDLGLYYLQSRYYDPVVCRFISPDSASLLPELIGGSLLGGNLYAYCNNDSINKIDPYGNASYTNSVRKRYDGLGYNVTTVISFIWTALTFNYKITENGAVSFPFIGNPYWSVLWRGAEELLAEAILNAARSVNKYYLYGRTVGGINAEIKLHYAAYLLYYDRDSSETVDIGGTSYIHRDYDYNAFFFEGIHAMQTARRIRHSNIYRAIGTVQRIRRYL